MYINRVYIRNFRILSDSVLDFKDDICLMIGKNNSGKTSFLVLFEKFLNGHSFDYNDFSLIKRKEILEITEETNVENLAIRLILNIKYEEKDNLSNLSEFIMDLDPTHREVNILFERIIQKDKLLKDIQAASNMSKEKFIKKNLGEYLSTNIFVIHDIKDLINLNPSEKQLKLIKKDMNDVKKLIDFEIIHAKRIVSSSEENNSKKVLSSLTTKYFNNKTVNPPDKFEEINKLIEKMDTELEENYKQFFDDFLGNARSFLNLDELKIISNLKANEIINDSSEVIYGSDVEQLPEYLNGLGHMNVLYLLLNIEIRKNSFLNNNKDIKLLFIEEPEAHTHPQLQYIFARKIKEIIKDIKGLQTIVTSHSPHIVTNHPFENIRYMLVGKDSDGYKNVTIKNFYQELATKYATEDKTSTTSIKNNKVPSKEFEFLRQYLTIGTGELFFTDKVIFIEGISESILMSHFISKFDKKMLEEERKVLESETQEKKSLYVPLASQNVSFIEVGANAKAFRHFIELLGIPTLIITDIDTTILKIKNNKNSYFACAVKENPVNTSNTTIKYYFNAPKDIKSTEFSEWFNKLISHELDETTEYVKIAYQKEFKGYYPRSFEDAFINTNLDKFKEKHEELRGLKNVFKIQKYTDIYKLTNSVVDKKSDFASSILFSILANNEEWEVPNYIWEGLEWLQKQ